MKVSSLITAAMLLGASEAAVHTMKLKKIPLEEQLVRFLPVLLTRRRRLVGPRR